MTFKLNTLYIQKQIQSGYGIPKLSPQKCLEDSKLQYHSIKQS